MESAAFIKGVRACLSFYLISFLCNSQVKVNNNYLGNFFMYTTCLISVVEALRQIAREVGKLDWNCSADPCSNRPNERCWNSTDSSNKKYANLVNCTCHDGTLHISHM